MYQQHWLYAAMNRIYLFSFLNLWFVLACENACLCIVLCSCFCFYCCFACVYIIIKMKSVTKHTLQMKGNIWFQFYRFGRLDTIVVLRFSFFIYVKLVYINKNKSNKFLLWYCTRTHTRNECAFFCFSFALSFLAILGIRVLNCVFLIIFPFLNHCCEGEEREDEWNRNNSTAERISFRATLLL